jgi:hypothetical protein
MSAGGSGGAASRKGGRHSVDVPHTAMEGYSMDLMRSFLAFVFTPVAILATLLVIAGLRWLFTWLEGGRKWNR